MNIRLRNLAAVAVAAATAITLSACGSDDSGSSATSTVTVDASSGAETGSDAASCDQAPPTGPLAVPTADADLGRGEAHFRVVLDDGTDECVSVTRAPGDDVAEWEVDDDDDERAKTEFEFRLGDAAAGLLVTATDRARDTDDDWPTSLPGAYGDPFFGIQVNGAYFPNSMHDSCDLTFTALSADTVAGEFECADLPVMEGGPFRRGQVDTPSTATKLVSAKGWFTASKN